MMFTINWTISGDLGNGSPPNSGSVQADAVERISVTVGAGSSEPLMTAVTDIGSLRLLVIGLSRYADATLKVGAGPAVALSGPAILDGGAARLLGATAPASVLVTNAGADDLVVEMLVCRSA